MLPNMRFSAYRPILVAGIATLLALHVVSCAPGAREEHAAPTVSPVPETLWMPTSSIVDMTPTTETGYPTDIVEPEAPPTQKVAPALGSYASLEPGDYVLRLETTPEGLVLMATDATDGVTRQIGDVFLADDLFGSFAWSISSADRFYATTPNGVDVLSGKSGEVRDLGLDLDCSDVGVSHNAQKLVAVCLDPQSGVFQLYGVDLTTYDVTSFRWNSSMDQEIRGVAWSPGDLQIAVVRYTLFGDSDGDGLYVLDSECLFSKPESCVPELLHQTAGDQPIEGSISWNATTGQIAAVTSYHIAVFERDGSTKELMELPEPGHANLAWDPTGKHLVIDYEMSGMVYVVDSLGLPARLVANRTGSLLGWLTVPVPGEP